MNAETACRRYVEAHAEVKRLTRLIGETLLNCPNERKEYSERSHLAQALYVEREDSFGDTRQFKRTMRDCEIRAEIEDCPLCTKAYALIKERKVARLKLGSAKRAVTLAGRQAQEASQP